jgi:hypothetical protein
MHPLDLQQWLEDLKDWNDPNPAPVIEVHEGFHIVRDDLLNYGSKIRFIDYMIGHDPLNESITDWCFGACPANGYAQISLPVVCKRYGKTAHIFMAKRSMDKLHPYQKRGMELGTQYHWIPDGMLNVTKARAFNYVAQDFHTRKALPLGLEHESVIASIVKVARALPIKPKIVWTVGSSGTLNRGLQLAWPDAEFHVVQVGHKMNEREIGRARPHEVPYKFDKAVSIEDAPPFPSAPTYDAKGWRPMIDWYKNVPGGIDAWGPILFWNVGA